MAYIGGREERPRRVPPAGPGAAGPKRERVEREVESPPPPPEAVRAESPIRPAFGFAEAQVVLLAALSGIGGALLAAAFLRGATTGAEFLLSRSIAGLALGLGLGVGSALGSGAWINVLLVGLTCALLGLSSGVVHTWFPESVTGFAVEALILLPMAACAIRRFENLRELDTYVLRPRERVAVGAGWLSLEGCWCGADCGVSGLVTADGFLLGLVVVLVVALAGGIFVALYGALRRLGTGVREAGMERMVDEIILLGSVAVLVSMAFGRILVAAVGIAVLLGVFLVYVPRLLSLSGLLLYGLPGLAVGLLPLWFGETRSLAEWVIFGSAAGAAMAGEAWVVLALLFLARTLEGFDLHAAAFRVYHGILRAAAGMPLPDSLVLRTAGLARRLERFEDAARIYEQARRWGQAGEAYLHAAARRPAPGRGA